MYYLRKVEICVHHFLVVESGSKLFFCFSIQTKPAKVRDMNHYINYKNATSLNVRKKLSANNEHVCELLAYSSISPAELSTTSL